MMKRIYIAPRALAIEIEEDLLQTSGGGSSSEDIGKDDPIIIDGGTPPSSETKSYMDIVWMMPLLLLLGILTSCSSDDENDKGPLQGNGRHMAQMQFAALPEATRSEVGADGKVLWQAGEKISVLAYDDSFKKVFNNGFSLATGAGTTSATFSGTMFNDIPVYYAVSPCQNGATLAGSGHSVLSSLVLPDVQNAVEGNYDPMASLAVAKCENLNNEGVGAFSFRNVCSYICLKPAFDCNTVVIEGNDGEALAGTIDVVIGDDGLPVSTVTQGVDKVTLTGDIKADQTYYVALLPATLEDGLTITCFKDDKVSNARVGARLVLNRSRSRDLALPASKTPQADIFVDLGLSVMWCACNVGASTPQRPGDYFAWGETAAVGGGYDGANLFSLYKHSATWRSYKWGDGSSSTTVRKYTAAGNLDATDDVATQLYGGAAFTATKEQWDELRSACDWKFENSGYRVTAPNGNSIFLPTTGYHGANGLQRNGVGYYWTSTVSSDSKWAKAESYQLTSEQINPVPDFRANAFAVRAVRTR